MNLTPSLSPSFSLFALDVFAPPHAARLANQVSDLAIVFLHYFGGSCWEWEEIIPYFAGRFRCIAPDLRGHGQSPDAPDAHSVDDMAGDVRQLLQTLGVTDCVLVGHSMGGKIALALAADPSVGVRRLLLLAPSPPCGQPMTRQEMTDTNDSWGMPDAMEKMLHKAAVLPVPALLAERFVSDNLRVTKPAWDAWQNEGSQEDISPRMVGVTVPTLVLSGECDPVIAPDLLARDLVARLPHATLQIVPGAGHLLPFETPQAVVAALQTLTDAG